MGTITTGDGTQIHFKDWGSGRPVVLSHGWPLNADSWESQIMHLASNGFRVIAHDRRGHGRSSQPWDRNDMDHYADDLAELIEALDLRDAALIGFSTGGGEVARYIGRHATARVTRAGLISAVPPLMVKTYHSGAPASAPGGWQSVSRPWRFPMRSSAGCWRPRLAGLMVVTSWLAACATAGSELAVVCPPVVEYRPEFQARAADELTLLPDEAAVAEMLSDYAVMRDLARSCGR